jgi:HEPN domain-containing protein
MNNNDKEGLRWLKQAAHVLKVAKDHVQLGNYSDTCFCAQQTAEMSIKAFLYKKGVRGITGHSNLYLLSEAAVYDERFLNFQSAARKLDRFYMSTRYPDALPELVPYEAFDESDAREAVQLAQGIYQFVEGCVSING